MLGVGVSAAASLCRPDLFPPFPHCTPAPAPAPAVVAVAGGRCGFCNESIGCKGGQEGSFVYSTDGDDPMPYHADCYRHVHAVLCVVCGHYIQPGPEGRGVSYKEVGFWKERYCSHHADADIARCGGCSRVKPAGACAWLVRRNRGGRGAAGQGKGGGGRAWRSPS